MVVKSSIRFATLVLLPAIAACSDGSAVIGDDTDAASTEDGAATTDGSTTSDGSTRADGATSGDSSVTDGAGDAARDARSDSSDSSDSSTVSDSGVDSGVSGDSGNAGDATVDAAGDADAGTVTDAGADTGSVTDSGSSTDGGDEADAHQDDGGSDASDAGPSDCAPLDGLRAWWAGEDTTGDEFGRHPGAWSGTPAYTTGAVGRAFQLGSGGTSYIEVADADDLDFTDAFTIDAWVNVSGQPTGRIVDKITAGSGDGYLLDLLNGVPRLIAGGTVVTANAPIASNTWVHLTAVYRSVGVADLYADGVKLTASAGGSSGPSATALPLRIGVDSTTAGNALTGGIDEVALYGRALDDAEVTRLAASGRCFGRRTTTNGSVTGLNLNEYVTLTSNGESVKVTAVGVAASQRFEFARPVIGGTAVAVRVSETSPNVRCSVAGTAAPFTVTCGPTYSSVVLADSPIAYFPMDETSSPIFDAANGFQGDAAGGVDFNVPGVITSGRAVAFDGTGQINVAYDARLNPSTGFSYERALSQRKDIFEQRATWMIDYTF